MHRRAYLGLAAGTAVTLAGCTASALPGPDLGSDSTPSPACPAVLDVDRTACPGDERPLAIDRSRTTVSGDRWSLVVGVTNRSGEPLGLNPYAWSVFRHDDDRWRHVAPDATIEPWRELSPGERYAWQLTARSADHDDTDQRVFLDLTPGTYAFAVPFRGRERIGAVVTFDVTA